MKLEDFVIPRNEKVSQFQVRDGQFLADNATRVSQASEERTVRTSSRFHVPRTVPPLQARDGHFPG